MRQDTSELREISPLELWRHANTPGDPEALAVFQHCLEETVLIWFHDHPGSQTACRLHSERYFVALAFERLQQAVLQRQVACETLSEVLVYLRVSLNGAILQTLRVFSVPGAISCAWSDGQGSFDKNAVWDRLQVRLSSERERRLAYLLYHCGLSPTEIVEYCPQEWSDVQEVVRLRRSILSLCMQRPRCKAP